MWQLDANCKPKIKQKQLDDVDCPCSQDYLHVGHPLCWWYDIIITSSVDSADQQVLDVQSSNQAHV